MEKEKKKLKTWHWILIVIGGLIILGAIFGGSNSSDSDNSNTNTNSDSGILSMEKITILNHQLSENDYGNLIISGTAKNVAGRNLDYAEIDVKFYDQDGAVIGNSLDNINNLGDGETWKFEVYYMGLDNYNVKNYSIEVGSAW
jgi:hypothetical protein